MKHYPGIKDVVARPILPDHGERLLQLGYEQINNKRPLDRTDSAWILVPGLARIPLDGNPFSTDTGSDGSGLANATSNS